MNIDQYFALNVVGLDAKVAYKTYQQEKAVLDSMLADLSQHGNEGVSAEYLCEALKIVNRVQAAHLEAIAALVFQK